MSTTNLITLKGSLPAGPYLLSSIERTDGAVRAVNFTHPDGTVAFSVVQTSYTTSIMIPAPPVMVKRKKLTAVNEEATINLPAEFYDPASYALPSYEARQRTLERAGFTVSLEDVEIEDPEAGG